MKEIITTVVENEFGKMTIAKWIDDHVFKNCKSTCAMTSNDGVLLNEFKHHKYGAFYAGFSPLSANVDIIWKDKYPFKHKKIIMDKFRRKLANSDVVVTWNLHRIDPVNFKDEALFTYVFNEV